jgi:hypothetical protein
VSATTMTAPGNLTGDFGVGDKLKLTQTTVKYFYVVGVAYALGVTTVTVAGGSDYALAAAAIMDVYISHVANPPGMPGFFNWTVVFTGFSTDPTVVVARFNVVGRMVNWQIQIGTAGTSNATTFTMSIPVTAATITNMAWNGPARVRDNGAWQADPGLWNIVSAGTVITLYKTLAAGAFTNSGTKSFTGQGWYGI